MTTERRVPVEPTQAMLDVLEGINPDSPSGDGISWQDYQRKVYSQLLAAAPEQPVKQGARHPEDYCEKCGGKNIIWFAPSELWNKYADKHNILCPICFVEIVGTAIKSAWKIVPEFYEQPAEPAAIHPHTEQCGFDRNASIAANHYVCMCGYEDNEPAATQEHIQNVEDSPGVTADDTVHPAPAAVTDRLVEKLRLEMCPACDEYTNPYCHEAADCIEQLTRQVAGKDARIVAYAFNEIRLGRERREWAEQATKNEQARWEQQQRATQAESALAKEREDAERYRWLNSEDNFLISIDDKPVRLKCGEPLDTWIDARIAALKESHD